MMLQKEKIIGRKYEIEKLEKAYHSKRAELIAVYGRRRIGKTYLIRNFFAKKECIFFQMTGIYRAPAQVQLTAFAEQIKSTFLPPYAELSPPKNWMDAFKLLTEILNQQKNTTKIVLFFDELPWMALKSSNLLQGLEYHWNRYWVNLPYLKFVICGSASSWIINKIIKNKGGLHNRVTLRLPLDPFNLAETRTFLEYEGVTYDDYQTTQIYMCFGGIPYYLTMLDKGLSAIQNINRICFQKKGELLDEFSLLFSSLFKKSEFYEQLVKLIASKRNGISREVLENSVKYKGGILSKRLSQLEQVGFIASFRPWGRSKKGIYYKIIDEYTLFYLTWILPTLKEKIPAEISSQYWEEISQTQTWKSWAGYAFEAVCFKHLNQIRHALHIPDSASVYPWKYIPNNRKTQESGSQIDLVFDRNDQIVNLCEIKYSKTPYRIDRTELDALLNKADVYRKVTQTKKLIFISLITTFGLKSSSPSISSVSSLSDLFKEITS